MGNTYYEPDPAIERWASMRENTHLTFRWNRRNIIAGLVWVVAVPAVIYYVAIGEYRAQEQLLGKKERKMLGK